jgi:hypothetical protein
MTGVFFHLSSVIFQLFLFSPKEPQHLPDLRAPKSPLISRGIFRTFDRVPFGAQYLHKASLRGDEIVFRFAVAVQIHFECTNGQMKAHPQVLRGGVVAQQRIVAITVIARLPLDKPKKIRRQNGNNRRRR